MKKTNSDKRSTSKRGHANERMKTSFRNSGRIAGMGILYDDYSEESYGGYHNITAGRVRTISDSMTPEERAELNGPVITYQKEDKP
jgi:hypothetical protein